MLNRFLAFISEKQLVRSVQPWLVAVSGGLDSVCLAHLCKQAGISFAIAHCNFGLRAGESEDDEAFVKNLAAQYAVPFYTARFDTETYALEHKLSVQQAARELRYKWFEQLRQENGFACIATAHHMSDTVETMLINQLRGTGIEGLHGIKPRNENVIRPLLFASRQEIAEYASAQSLLHREDSSNQSDKYLRNAIRHHVVPALKEIEPETEKIFSANAARFESFEQLAMMLIKKQWQDASEIREDSRFVSLHYLSTHFPGEAHLTEFLYQNLKYYGFNAEQALIASELINAQSGRQLLSGTHILLKDREHFIIMPKYSTAVAEIQVPAVPAQGFHSGNFSFEWLSVADVDFRNAPPHIACLDADTLEFPLTVRSWQQGDAMKPMGLKGRKKISDILVDEKVPLSEKESVQVLLSGNEIAWLAGMRIAEPFKITAKTLKVLKITLEGVFSPEYKHKR